MEPVKVVRKELRRLFGAYAYQLEESGILDDDRLRNFYALRWNRAELRAEVYMLPDPAPLVALGKVEFDEEDGGYYVQHHWLQEAVPISPATAIGLGKLQQIQDCARKELGAGGWKADEADTRMPQPGFPPEEIAAFNEVEDESGIEAALALAIEEYPANLNANRFAWNDATNKLDVWLLTRRGRPVRLPVTELTAIHHVPGTLFGRAWHTAQQRHFVVPDLQTLMALRYLDELRSEAAEVRFWIAWGYTEPYHPPSPAESAVSQDSAPGSSEDDSASSSTSSTAATSTTESNETASAAAGPSTMYMVDVVDHPIFSFTSLLTVHAQHLQWSTEDGSYENLVALIDEYELEMSPYCDAMDAVDGMFCLLENADFLCSLWWPPVSILMHVTLSMLPILPFVPWSSNRAISCLARATGSSVLEEYCGGYGLCGWMRAC